MKIELNELIKSCINNNVYNKTESLELIRELCDNKTISKLIDEHNYMTYTMPTEFSAYKQNIKPEIREKLLNDPIDQTIDLQKNLLIYDRYSEKGEFRYFIGLLNKTKNKGLITPNEWREQSTRWRKFPQDREYLISIMKEKISLLEAK